MRFGCISITVITAVVADDKWLGIFIYTVYRIHRVPWLCTSSKVYSKRYGGQQNFGNVMWGLYLVTTDEDPLKDANATTTTTRWLWLKESSVRFGVAVWFGNLSVRSKLLRLVQTAGKIIGVRRLPSLQAALKQAQKIVCDVTHVLNGECVVLPSGRRYKEPKWKYIRFKKSFVPVSTKMLNESLKQQWL